MSRKIKELKEDPKKIKEALNKGVVDYAVPIKWAYMADLIRFIGKAKVFEILGNATGRFKRRSIPFVSKFLLIYIIKLFVGISSIRGMKELLSDYGTMKLIGFSHEEFSKGLCARGKGNQYGRKYIRKAGIMDTFTVTDNIARFNVKSVIGCHDAIIKEQVRQGVEFGEVYAVDSTIIETPEGYPGAGKTVREEREDCVGSTPAYIYGFKLFVVYDIKTRITVAMDIVSAEKPDSKYLFPMVEKAEQNLGRGKIKVIVADRGFIDGNSLWRLKYEKGIEFIIPAKRGMTIWEDAVGFRETAERAGMVETWYYGKGESGGYFVPGLLSYGEYNKEPAKSKKYRNGCPLNAVVVTLWRGKKIAAGKEKVLLTGLSGGGATGIIKGYRLRSYVENCEFRELKQAAYLSLLPKRRGKDAENSAYVHIALSVITYTIFYAFLYWRKFRRRAKTQLKKDPIHLREFRKQTNLKPGAIFILDGRYYAILSIDEVFEALGIKQRFKHYMRN